MKAKKLPSGNYRTQVVAGYDENGKRIVKSFTAETEWEAIRMAQAFKDGQIDLKKANITLKNAMEVYITSRANIIEKTTIRGYRQIQKHCFQSIMDVKITALQPIDIQRAVNLESARVSPKYVKNAYGLLKSVFKMYEVNINLSNIILPKLKRKEKTLPTFDIIFHIVKGSVIELPVLLSAWLSLRIGEIVGLQFRDVDIEKRTLKVRRTIISTENGEEMRDGCKTEKSTRELALPDYLYEMITAIPHENDTDFIVPHTRKSVYSRFKRMTRCEGIEMTFHDLRHLNA